MPRRSQSKLWTHGMPKGPKGRFVSVLPRFQGIWNFSKNKSAAKSLMLHVSTRAAAEKLVDACQGYDLPPYVKFNDFKTWNDVGPPPGHPLALPQQGRSGVRHSLRAGPAGDRRPDLLPSHRTEDGRADGQGRAHCTDAGLGDQGDRGFLPQLTTSRGHVGAVMPAKRSTQRASSRKQGSRARLDRRLPCAGRE